MSRSDWTQNGYQQDWQKGCVENEESDYAGSTVPEHGVAKRVASFYSERWDLGVNGLCNNAVALRPYRKWPARGEPPAEPSD